MESQLRWFDILIAFLLLALMTIAGTWGAKDETEEDYLIGGRNVPDWKLAGTISAGLIGGGVLLVFSEYTFRYGVSAFFILGGIILGTLATIPIALRFKKIADRQSFYTLPDLYAYEWGTRAGLLSTLIISLWTIGFVIMQLISAGEILAEMTQWHYWTGVVIAALTVASYLVISGFRAVVITDVLQYMALILLLILIWPIAVNKIGWGGLSNAFATANSQHLDMGNALGFFILGFLNMLVSADMWQRFYAARSEKDARRGLILSAILVSLAGLLLLVPPLFARAVLPNVAPNRALIESLKLLLPRALLGFGLVGILSTVVATLDTMVFILGISVGHDMRVQQLNKPVEDRVRTTRIAIVVALVIGSLLAILYRQLLNTGLALSSLGLVLAPSLIFRVVNLKPSPFAVNLGMALGLATAFFLIIGNFFISNLLSPENTLYALGMAIAGTALGALISKVRSK
jgi:SSS family solute:Na+ symporter